MDWILRVKTIYLYSVLQLLNLPSHFSFNVPTVFQKRKEMIGTITLICIFKGLCVKRIKKESLGKNIFLSNIKLFWKSIWDQPEYSICMLIKILCCPLF